MTVTKLVSTSLLTAAITLTASAEKAIKRNALPSAVEKTVQTQSQGAIIKGFTRETEGGILEYEVELMVAGHSKDVAIGKDGKVLEVEEQVEMASLPSAVQQAITAKARHAKITKVESLMKDGKLVAYEAATLSGTKKGEIQIGPNGETLRHEE